MRKSLILWGWIPGGEAIDRAGHKYTYGGEWMAWCSDVGDFFDQWQLERIAKALVREKWFEHYVIAADMPTHRPDAVLAGKKEK